MKIGASVLALVAVGAAACDKPSDNRSGDAPAVRSIESGWLAGRRRRATVRRPNNRAECTRPRPRTSRQWTGRLGNCSTSRAARGQADRVPVAQEARKQPTPTDAVLALLKKEGKSPAPLELASVVNRKIPGAGGQLDIRIDTPKPDEKKPLPVVVYYHGGGFFIADLDVYD